MKESSGLTTYVVSQYGPMRSLQFPSLLCSEFGLGLKKGAPGKEEKTGKVWRQQANKAGYSQGCFTSGAHFFSQVPSEERGKPQTTLALRSLCQALGQEK